MMIREKSGIVALGALAIALIGGLSTVAQEPAASKAAPIPKKKQDPSRRVPPYFGQIGLTPEQRESVYAVQAKHYEKIAALEKQIADIKAGSLAECEGVLTDVQKKLLDNLRRAGAEPAKKAAPKPVDAPKPAG